MIILTPLRNTFKELANDMRVSCINDDNKGIGSAYNFFASMQRLFTTESDHQHERKENIDHFTLRALHFTSRMTDPAEIKAVIEREFESTLAGTNATLERDVTIPKGANYNITIDDILNHRALFLNENLDELPLRDHQKNELSSLRNNNKAFTATTPAAEVLAY